MWVITSISKVNKQGNNLAFNKLDKQIHKKC